MPSRAGSTSFPICIIIFYLSEFTSHGEKSALARSPKLSTSTQRLNSERLVPTAILATLSGQPWVESLCYLQISEMKRMSSGNVLVLGPALPTDLELHYTWQISGLVVHLVCFGELCLGIRNSERRL